MAKDDKAVGFPQDYPEAKPTRSIAELNPDHVVDLVTPANERVAAVKPVKVAPEKVKPVKAPKVAKVRKPYTRKVR